MLTHQKFFFTAPDGTAFTGKHKAAAYLRSVLGGGELDCRLIMDFAPVAGKPVKRDRSSRGLEENKPMERQMPSSTPPPQNFENLDLWRERMIAANAACLKAEMDQLMRSMAAAKVVEEPTLEENSAMETNQVVNPSAEARADLGHIKSEQFEADVENQEQLSDQAISSPNSLEHPLPPGWILSTSGEVTPPSNLALVFPNRRKAFQALTLSKCSEEMLRLKDSMFDQLEHEGWRASTLLPPGWIYNYQGPHSLTFLDKAGHYFDCVDLMVGWLNSQGMAESVIQSVLALQAQFERLQAEPEEVQQLQSKVQGPEESQPGRKTLAEPEQLAQAQIQVTPPTQSLVLAPRLIKLQAPRSLETLQPMTMSSSMETQSSKMTMLSKESETLKMVTSKLEAESSRRFEENQRTFPSLPGWQRHGPKGLVCYQFSIPIKCLLFPILKRCPGEPRGVALHKQGKGHQRVG